MEDPRDVRVHVSVAALIRPLAWGAVVMLVAGTTALVLRTVHGRDNGFGLIPMLNLDREYTFPALYSSLLLLAGSLVLGAAAAAHRARGSRLGGGWAALSLGFLVMVVDETLSLHEELIDPIRERLGAGPGEIFHFGWVVVALPFVLVVWLALRRWLGALDSPTRQALLRAGAVYLAGALGMEMLGGAWAARHGVSGLGYGLLVAVEEGLEMLGALMSTHAVLDHLRRHFGALTFDLGPAERR